MNKHNILIMGSNSYVGHFLGIYLQLENEVEYLEEIFKSKLNSFNHDIKEVIPNFDKYDSIIYLIHDHSNDVNKNLHIINLVLKKIKDNQKLIFFSSSQVDENNQNNYTKVKQAIEAKIIKENNNYIILRPCLMLDEKISIKKNKEQFLITLLKFIEKYKIALLLANGKFYLNLVSILDVFKIIKQIISKNIQNEIITIYNNESLTFLEIVNIIKLEFKIKKIIMIPVSLFVLNLISKLFPNKISKENLKALKFKPHKFYQNFKKADEIKFHNFEYNKNILKKLYKSL